MEKYVCDNWLSKNSEINEIVYKSMKIVHNKFTNKWHVLEIFFRYSTVSTRYIR